MGQFIIQSVIFTLASSFSIGLIYVSKNYQFYQQLIPILLILDIAVASRIKSGQDAVLSRSKLVVLFISSLLVQTIVISSGGLYSPLLILVHIFTLGAILLLGSSSPIIFLASSLGVLIFHISYDKNLYQFFQNDPWAVAIYALSIAIVIPLALYLSHSNSVKSKFNDFLKDYIKVSEQRQKSIMTALSNLVVVTDKGLSILSVNTAFERLLRLSTSQVINKPILEVIKLRDVQNNVVTVEMLPVKEAIADKATHFTEGYSLEISTQTLPKPVTIQIKPVADTRGQITQIIFVFTDPLVKIGFNTHPSVKEAVRKHDSLLSVVTGPQDKLPSFSVQLLILLIAHIEEDILTVQEMEDHPLQEVIGFVDLVVFTKQILDSKKMFYEFLGITPNLKFEDESKSEEAFLNMDKSELTQSTTALSKYSAPVDGYLLKIVLSKIIDLAVFITASAPHKNLDINLHLADSNQTIVVDIQFPSGDLKEADLPNLFIKDYPRLKISTLKDASGLEGYIADKVAKTVQMELSAGLNPVIKTATLSLALSKIPKIHTQNSS